MAVRELAVARDACVDDRAIELRADVQRTAPVLGRDAVIDGGEVGSGHADDTAGLHRRHAAVRVPHAEAPEEQPVAEVQFLAIGEDLHVREVEPFAVPGPERERQPVGQVDQVFVDDRAPGHLAGEAVVAAGQIGARVVDAIRIRLFCRAARDEDAVTECAQRFAKAFLARVDAIVRQHPRIERPGRDGGGRGTGRVHRPLSSRSAVRRSSSSRTSRTSWRP